MKNHIDMLIFHTAVCAVPAQNSHDATCVLEAHMRVPHRSRQGGNHEAGIHRG